MKWPDTHQFDAQRVWSFRSDESEHELYSVDKIMSSFRSSSAVTFQRFCTIFKLDLADNMVGKYQSASSWSSQA